MIQYLKQYASTHVFYLIVIAVCLVAFRSWRAEHDARIPIRLRKLSNETL